MRNRRSRRAAAKAEKLWDESRLSACAGSFRRMMGREPTHAFSSPGRTELGGNHTDHNRGKVLAASIDLDMLAAVAARSDGTIRIFSEGFGDPFNVETSDCAMRPEERGTSTALIRGIVSEFVRQGDNVGGFDAWMTSRVGVGSGLSSSACFEVLVGCVLNTLYNSGRISPGRIAVVGKVAENGYFGKPCGLMDQVTCSVGGTLRIDFQDPDDPNIRRVDFDPRRFGFELVVVNTGSTHEDLTAEYAAIPDEMRSVARFLGAEYCRDVDVDVFLDRLAEVRTHCGDRAALRCMHFFGENERVEKQFRTLKQDRFPEFLALVQQSGDSSMKYLQNIFPAGHPLNQSLTLALAQTDRFLSRHGTGAYRVHGGGFAGTIQAYIPAHARIPYRRAMSALFGENSVQTLTPRKMGVASRIL